MIPQAPRRPITRPTGRGPPPIKKLFTPDSNKGPEEDTQGKETTEALKSKIQMDCELDACRKAQEKELHEQRLKDLKDLLKTVAQDDWQYTSADKLIGL